MSQSGPCAKRTVRCRIVTPSGIEFTGTNDCLTPQNECPRLPGEGYEKCKSICNQTGHAEANALKAAGNNARGATAYVINHFYICKDCGELMEKAGIKTIVLGE